MSTDDHHDYRRVERALAYLAAHRADQPTLDEVAAQVGLSPFHFQRLFVRWVGISPKRFLQFLTVEHARGLLAETRSVLEATFETGLSSPGRLHDLTVAVDAMTPGELSSGGAGLVIRHALVGSPFGECLIAVSDRGVCWLSFPGLDGGGAARQELVGRFPNADHLESRDEIADLADRIFDGSTVDRPLPPVLLAGTNFQLKVWEALLRIPTGGLCSYSDLAGLVGRPSATRAVASAVAANHVAFLIPCHRVIRALGGFGEYRWGAARKEAMIGWEAARRAALPA
ncbi:MAG: methylated-DNA--[protein]-cysteine S-methyltransferase [Thermoanaerobaculales bacterium]|jgi:AraC family transcriptional regulator of adaptative response/methylated-DNA-[protein]-cysteine methyltransferase|nr:methylated-DNA--[protein]-cysteine S-methyltransferase [Thermoanaerobaculales bacterium]